MDKAKEQYDGLSQSLHTPQISQESLLIVFWNHRWLLLIALVITMLLGVVYLLKATPIYTSESRVYVEQTGPRIMSELEDGVMTRSKNYLYTQAELMRASPIIAEALKRCQAEHMQTFDNIDNPVGFLKEKIQTLVGKKDDIIHVMLGSPYPKEAAQIVNAIVDSYITFHSSRKRTTTLDVLKILQNEKAECSKELSEQLQAIVEFKKENEELVFQTDTGNLILERLNRLSVALTESQLQALEAKSIYETSQNMISDANKYGQFIDAQRSQRQYGYADTELERLKSKLDRLQQQRADTLIKLKANHPAIAALDTEIKKTQARIYQRDEQFALAQISLIKQEYNTSQEKVNQLRVHFEECRQEAVTLNQKFDQFALLQSECNQTKRLCDILDDRIKELNVTEDVGALNITILEVARPADLPSSPVRAKVLAISLVLGLMIGVGAVLTRDMMNHRITRVEEVAGLIQQPVLGVVPGMSRRLTILERGQQVELDSNSHAAEAFRSIRTAIYFSMPQEQAQMIHVSSAFAAAGKSTLVSNLGISMAQSGQRVLILDGDFRKPIQHTIFGMKNEVGLTTVLAGLVPLRSVLLPTSIKGLDLLPAGPSATNPAEMLGSSRFKTILEKLQTRYERILIDSPPTIPVADGSILSALSNATILVVRLKNTRQKAFARAQEIIGRVGGHIIGCVVNDANSNGLGYGSYGYGYGYGYQSSESKQKGGNGDAVRVSRQGILRSMRAESTRPINRV